MSKKLKWKRMDRDLKKGEIIRFKPKEPNNEPNKWDGYVYGRARGGFGMGMNTIGEAIFVDNEAWSYDDCKNKVSKDNARWQRDYHNVEVIVEGH